MNASICRPRPHFFPSSSSSSPLLTLSSPKKSPKTLPFLYPTASSFTFLPLSTPLLLSKSSSPPNLSTSDSPLSVDDGNDDSVPSPETSSDKGVDIEKIGNNARRIRSQILIDVSLDTIWNLLTDYERLSDFIPGLAVCRLLDKKDNFARLFQIGQQNLAFGLKFNAKGIVDCYEKDLEHLPFGQRRDIEFKMIEGDFKTFEGKWSIVQIDSEKGEDKEDSDGQEFETILSYVVDVEPKMWLPVHLVEGILCKEIELNLICIRDEAHRTSSSDLLIA